MVDSHYVAQAATGHDTVVGQSGNACGETGKGIEIVRDHDDGELQFMLQ